MIVDHQWHWMPRELLDALAERTAPPRAEQRGDQFLVEVASGAHVPVPPALIDDIGAHVEIARAHGIDAIVCSPSFVGDVLHLDPGEAADLLERANAAMARAQREHPENVVGLAQLPLQSADAAFAVLESAVVDGLRGVCVLASIDGAPVATEATLPVFERIEELGLPVVLHPAVRSNTSRQGLGILAEVGAGWMYHTTLAALNLITSGTLDACRQLVVLHPHLGGVLPYILGRVDRLPGEDRSIPEYLRRHFYVDTVSATPAALELATETYGIDRVVFATDYPYVSIEPGLEYVRKNASADAAAAIFANRVPGLAAPQ